jgi:AbrB family looped-hinge helix DNA binding protein
METVKVDAKGRLAIPAHLRGEIGMHPGDVYFLKVEDSILHLAKAENPFDALARRAKEEYEAGETMDLRAFAQAEGIDLDDE